MRMFQYISGANWAADFFFSLHSLKCTFTEHHSILEQDVWIQIYDSQAFLKLLLYTHWNQMWSSGPTFFIQSVKWSVMSDSLTPWYSHSARLLCPWNSTGKNIPSISFSRGSSPFRDGTRVFHTAGKFFTIWATREAFLNYLWFGGKFY